MFFLYMVVITFAEKWAVLKCFVYNQIYKLEVYRACALLLFSFFILLRCHFQRIWPFFFQRRELRFIWNIKSLEVIYKDFVLEIFEQKAL